MNTPIGHGRTSEVYAYGEDRALKLYPVEEDRAGIEQEARAAVLIHELGVPSVRCDGLIDQDGQLGIIFERLDGLSFSEVAERDLRQFAPICRDLADCHARQHQARTDQLPDVRMLAAELLTAPGLRDLTAAEAEQVRAYLAALPEGDQVLHLDFHPQNVYRHRDGWAIIDWHSACRGPAAADVAMSVILMSEVELFPGTPPLKLVLYQLVRRLMLRLYRARYLSVTPVTAVEISRWLLCARVLRLGLLNIDSEHERILRKVRRQLQELDA